MVRHALGRGGTGHGRASGGGSAIAPDGSFTVAGTYTAVGGTGRFAGATGTAVFAETAHLTDRGTAAGSYTLEGRLAY
jgi:hypothetical protein